MIERLSNVFILGVELLEAEGRVARKEVRRLLGDVALLLAAVALGVAGALALLVGLTWLVTMAVGVPVALLIVGAVATTVGVLLTLGARHRLAALPAGESTQ